MTAEFGNHLAFAVADGHVIDAGASQTIALERMGRERVSPPGRLQERHRAVLGHRALIVGAAREGEGRIGKREDETAVADAVSVRHVGADRH